MRTDGAALKNYSGPGRPGFRFCFAVLLGLAAAPGLILAESEGDAARGAGQRPTLVARLQLPAGTLDAVRNSTELAMALRQHLAVELALPLADHVTVQFRGFGGAQAGKGPVFSFVFPAFRAEGPLERQTFPVDAAIRASLGEDAPVGPWQLMEHTEAKASDRWDTLAEALEVGLPQSAKGSAPDSSEAVELQVKAVHLLEFAYDGEGGGQWEDFQWCCEDFDGRYVLQIMPELSFPPEWHETGEMAKLAFEQNVLVIEIEY